MSHKSNIVEASIPAFLQNMSEEDQIKYIKQRPELISNIRNPSAKLQLIAVSEDINALLELKTTCDEVQDYVLSHYTEWAIHITNPSPRIFGKYQKPVIRLLLELLSGPNNEVYDIMPYPDQEDVYTLIKSMAKSGINWPEFEIIKNSALG